MIEDAPSLTADEQRHYIEALDTLPLLTRAVFMIARFDDLSYPDIAWRCGISEAEVQVRFTDALLHIRHYLDGRRRVIGYVRRELRPWRDDWAASRAREADRRLAPWLSPERRPGRRSLLDWMARAYELLTR